MSTFTQWLWILGAPAVAYIAGHFIGYEVGIRQTEKRWSEAVARAESERARLAAAPSNAPPASDHVNDVIVDPQKPRS